jgi:hypothetical protein
MAMYKISLVGLYEYDNNLFEHLTLPTFVIPENPPKHVFLVDKDTLVATILEKSADFPALYPDWDFMHFMVGVWSKNCAYMMQTLFDSLNYNFNPIENYDRKSTISRSGTNTGNGTSTNARTAFNTDNMKNTDSSTSNATDTVNENVSEYVHGNIGVRSGQELVEQTRNMAMFKWYDIVARDFINKFCVQIY